MRLGGRIGAVIPIRKNNLTALTRLAVLDVLSSARRLVILFFRIGISRYCFLKNVKIQMGKTVMVWF